MHENVAERVVAGVFDGGSAALGQEHLRGEPQGVLSAHCDKDFIGLRDDAAARQSVAGDKLDQFGIVLIVVIGGEGLKILGP